MRLLNKIFVSAWFQRIMNRNKLSAFVGRLADKQLPGWILKSFIRRYIKSFKIDITEYDFKLNTVKTFNEFFSRKLLEGRREFKAGIASPVEGFVSYFGKIVNQELVQVKGRNYSFGELIGESAAHCEESSYVTIYLSPADYHRIHAPFDMQIEYMRYIPGTLLSVSLDTIAREDKVYCRNERIILKGKSEYGDFCFILVGAVIVGKIKLSFDDTVSNCKKSLIEKEFNDPVIIKKGSEIGCFEMGSTVILTLNNDRLADINRGLNSRIILGESLCL